MRRQWAELMLCVVLVLNVTAFQNRNGMVRKLRYLLYNPGDMSTLIGYQNHHVPDMTSLLNEASANAHGGKVGQSNGGQVSSNGPYNIPNFPAMGGSVNGYNNNMATGTGITAANSATGSASFAGTNQWRCDSHVVETCDTQCLDVDPKDGCPFCITGCSQKLAVSGAQSNTQAGNQPQTSLAGSSVQGSLNTGNQQGSQSGSGTGALIQLPFGLTGTGNQGTKLTSSPQTGSNGGQGCLFYPPNCPKIYTKLENGCLVCTVLKQGYQTGSVISTVAVTTTKTTTTTRTPVVATCAPKRCIPPCDKGIVLGSDGCPYCLCPTQI